jgi:hypothetical protein
MGQEEAGPDLWKESNQASQNMWFLVSFSFSGGKPELPLQ